MKISDKLTELLHQYFELGVAEGREGRNHDKEAGDAQRVLSEIEAEIGSLSHAEPIAWESTSPGYIKYVTGTRYSKFRDEVKKWYKPFRCSSCSDHTSSLPFAVKASEAKYHAIELRHGAIFAADVRAKSMTDAADYLDALSSQVQDVKK